MNGLEKIYSKTLSGIDSSFEKTRKSSEEQIGQSKQQVAELFESYGFSPNAVQDFNRMLLYDNADYPLPYALRVGNLLPKGDLFAEGYIPAILPYTDSNATAFVIDQGKNHEQELQHIFQLLAFRLMLSVPAGMSRFHFVDTHSYGNKFSIMNRLSDKIVADAIVNDESKLEELIKELEQTVIDLNQNQLIKYPTLEEYNKKADVGAVPYHFVFITNFPHGFSKDLTERFYKLIQNRNATRAGIYIFYSIDNTVAGPYGFDASEFMNVSSVIYPTSEGSYEIDNSIFDKAFNENFSIQFQTELPENIGVVIEAINSRAENVKQPIISLDEYIESLIESQKYWQASSRQGIKIPIGKKPIDDTVYFELGGDTADYFAMIGGRPGYGKTVLLHDIICNASIIYSPRELNFYLIDCTNGTGFKPYETLPHATFVSITNQREYTVSALEHLIDEMYRRAELFKNAGEELRLAIEKIEEYRKQSGEILPRILVIIDEFQVLLENGDKISRKAGFHLEKIIREGRKYGIHIIFSTQSYRNLDFNTDLITLRIAFNLRDYDSIKVLGGHNDEAAKLTKKGEAILNNKNGDIRENIKFQCAFTDKMPYYVNFCNSKLGELESYSQRRYVFDGSTNSEITENTNFASIASLDPQTIARTPSMSKIYVGAPSFIRGEHSYFKIRNNHCSNLLMVGGDIEAAMSTLMLANYQLAKQNPTNSQFHIVDFLSADDPRYGYYSQICDSCDNIYYYGKSRIGDLVDAIEQELNVRIENDRNGIGNADRGRIVLSLSYVQNAKDLKKSGYSVSPITDKLIKILRSGPDLGIHIMVYSHNFKGLEEIFDRQVLGEFENRIVLSEGGGESILSESSSMPKGRGHGLIQTDEKSATYNPDPFVFYNSFEGNAKTKDGKILKEVFSIYEQKTAM